MNSLLGRGSKPWKTVSSHTEEATHTTDTQGGASFLPVPQLLASTFCVPGSDPSLLVSPANLLNLLVPQFLPK